MTTATIPSDLIREIHKQTSPELKSALEKALPNFFARQWQSITSFEVACEALGRDPNDPFFSACRPHENAIRKLEVVCEALNEGKKLDFSDENTYKWWVWVIWDKSIGGFRFGAAAYGDTSTRTGLGSRLCLVDRLRAEHLGKHFIQLINETLQ